MATFYKYENKFFGDLQHEYVEGLIHLGHAEGFEYYSMTGEVTTFPTQTFAVEVVLLADLKLIMDKLNAVSTLSRKCSQKIRAAYSVDEEFKALRTNNLAYVTFVEGCVAEFQTAKAELGII